MLAGRALLVCLAAVVALAACRRAGPGTKPPAAPNLLLISIDTLRADRLGSAGYAAARTPHLDALAARGLRFEQATTVVPLTLPAHASLLTGTFPGHHGVRDNGGFYLGDEQVTLAETLKGRGYRTGGFVGAFVLDSRWGIAQGFDHFFDDFDLSRYSGVGMDTVQRRGDEVAAKAAEWMAADSAQPFFAWVHLYDPHTPYDAPEPYRSRFPATLDGAYDAEIAWTDDVVGRLLARLGPRLQDTVVVVVGDHGESLGEHEEQTHGFFVYDATIQIPLIVAGPGAPVKAIAEQVRIVDVMPTALELLGVDVPKPVQGVSLMPLARGGSLGLVALAESWFPRYHYGWSELRTIRDGRYKYIEAPRPELYDLKVDAAETTDLASRDAGRTLALGRALSEMGARVEASARPRAPQAVDPETAERLQALGYVGGTVSDTHIADGATRGDPKDKIGLYNLLKQAGAASVAGRLDEAVALARKALAADPAIIEGHTLLGNFHSKARRYDDAVAAYRQALKLDPEHDGATFSLALAYKNQGRLEDAEAGFERARTLDSRNTKALWQLADIWMRRRDFVRAEGALKEALGTRVDRPAYLAKLGECYLEMQRPADARAALQEALAARADLPGGQFHLALAYEALRQPALAVAAYEAALRLDPKDHRAAFNLGKLLLASRRSGDAVRLLRQSIATKPDFGTGHLYLAKALLDAGDLDGAAAAARTGLKSRLEPGTAPLGHYVLADVYTRQGRERDAAREVAAAKRWERSR